MDTLNPSSAVLPMLTKNVATILPMNTQNLVTYVLPMDTQNIVTYVLPMLTQNLVTSDITCGHPKLRHLWTTYENLLNLFTVDYNSLYYLNETTSVHI